MNLNDKVGPQDLARAGIRVLDDSEPLTVVAFADLDQLKLFQERIAEFKAGPVKAEQKNPPYSAFMDSIIETSEYLPALKIKPRVQELRAVMAPNAGVLLDVECWHPDDPVAAEEWQNEVKARVHALNGTVLDSYLSNNSLLSLLRVRLPLGALDALASMSAVARIDVRPDPQLNEQQIYNATINDLPRVPPPAADAPVVGVVDSGLRTAHPLIAGAVLEAVSLTTTIPDGQDRNGHGTAVTALVLHGRLEPLLRTPSTNPPPCRIVSVSVLDEDKMFPENVLWEHLVADAIEHCARRGARIVNLSVGNLLTPYGGAKATPVAALLDEIAGRLGVVLVISTGNVHPVAYLDEKDANTPQTYVTALAASEDSRLIDPAPSALALTVGSIRGEQLLGPGHHDYVEQLPLGEPDWPSSFTRRGTGMRDAVKPELVAPGGTHAYDDAVHGIVPGPQLVVAAARADRLLELDLGTSYSTGLVTHALATVASRHPGANANLLRALTLQSAQETLFLSALKGGTDLEHRTVVRSLQGYGLARAEEASTSTDHRVVMYGTATITVNDVQLWPIPVPASFIRASASRELVIALAFDPPTRGRRIDYLASTMQFDVVRGLTPESIDAIYRSASEEDLEGDDTDARDAEGGGAPDEGAEVAQPTQRKQLGRRLLPLDPNANVRRWSANQLARWRFRNKLRVDEDTYYLVVRNVGRWADEGSTQDYAIAVAWAEQPGQPSIYVQLEARLRVGIQVELEAR